VREREGEGKKKNNVNYNTEYNLLARCYPGCPLNLHYNNLFNLTIFLCRKHYTSFHFSDEKNVTLGSNLLEISWVVSSRAKT
jgi:hypothetical protein